MKYIAALQHRLAAFAAVTAILACGSFASPALAAQVTLSWNPNSENDLAGYRLHYGKNSGSYTSSVDVRNVTQYTLTGLNSGQTYFFVATAYDRDGNASGYSQEISYTVPQAGAAVSSQTGSQSAPAAAGSNLPASSPSGTSGGSQSPPSTAAAAGPRAPALVSPAAEDNVSTEPLLRTGPFKSAGSGSAHAKTEWQVFRDEDDACVLDIRTSSALTRLEVPQLVLDGDTRYFWRARFLDAAGVASDWSDFGYFVTETGPDRNANGIPDEQEVGLKVDVDKNGVKDRGQQALKVVRARGGTQVGVGIGPSRTALAIESVAAEKLSKIKLREEGKAGKTPFGIINYKVAVANPGDQTEVTLYFSEQAPVAALPYSYDPVSGTWRDLSASAVFAADRMSLTLTSRDGGPEDVDGTENGVIVNPACLVVLKPAKGKRYLAE